MEVVRFPRFTEATVKPHKVYLRTSWADPWVHVPYLFADECTWCVAPSIPTASLTWRFGHGQQHDQWFAQWYSRLTGKVRTWVKIEYESQNTVTRDNVPQADNLVWVGSIETDATALGGTKEKFNAQGDRVQRDTGLQTFACYGLAQTLNRIPIDRSYWYDGKNVLRVSGRVFTFNSPDAAGRGRGNFNNRNLVKTFEHFGYRFALANWSTRSIVQNLITAFPPRDCLGDAVFVTSLTDETILPNTDRPVFDPTGMSLWEALCNLIARTRMLGFYLQYVPGVLFGNNDFVTIQPYSLAGADQTFGEIEIPANPNQVRIEFETDADITGAGVKGSSTPAIDQFILRGARRTSTCSLSKADSTLDAGWSEDADDPDESDYEFAGSVDGDYAGMSSTKEKQTRNSEVRASAALHHIYRLFVHAGNGFNDWDQQAGNGEGGDKHPIFPDGNDQFWVYPRELFILPCVLLEEGRTYTELGSLSEPIAPPIFARNANNRQPPLCFVKVPAASSPDRYWVEGAKLAENAPREEHDDLDNRRFSIRTEVPQMSYGLYLHVEGQPQHAIAYADFVPLPVDPGVGRYNWREFIVTVSFEDDRHCEGVWPPNGLLAALLQAGAHVRRQVLYAGDSYRQDWIVPGTVVDVDPHTGQLQRNAAGGWIADDSAKLQARARQIHAYFSQPRRALTFSTGRINSALQLGEYVVERGDLNREPIGAVITQMSISSPENALPRLTYDTAFLELEAVQL